jgi:hypothetical protein
MRIALGLVIATLLAGCAGATHVVSTGPGTYMVASHGTMGWWKRATTARSRVKEMQAINSSETECGFGKIASGEVDFRYVAPGATSK